MCSIPQDTVWKHFALEGIVRNHILQNGGKEEREEAEGL
jgi:hypothetical protein